MKATHVMTAMVVGAAVVMLTGPFSVLAADDVVGAEVVRPPASLADLATTPPSDAPDAGGVQAVGDEARRMLEQEASLKAVRWEKAKAAAQQYEEQARALLLKPQEQLTQDDFTRARRLLADAAHVLSSNEDVAVPSELAAWNTRLAETREYVQKTHQDWEVATVKRELEIVRIRQEQEARRIAEQRGEQVENLMEQAMAMRQEGNFGQEIILLEQLLKIDPAHRQAKWMLADAQNYNVVYQQHRINEVKDLWERRTLLNVREALTPFDEPMHFPPADVWQGLIERRRGFEAGTPPESPADQRVRELMQRTVPEIRFSAIGFENALNFLRDLQRVNLNPNWGAMEAMGITRLTEVTLQLRDVTFETALRELLAKAAGREGLLDYLIRDGVIKVSTTDDLSTLKYILVYDVRDLVHPLADFRVPAVSRDLGTRTSGDSGTGAVGGGGQAGGLFGDVGGTQQVDETAAEESRQEKVESFLQLLRSTVTPQDWAPAGESSLTETDGLLVIKQTAAGHRDLGRLLQQLREHSRMQITIEVRFLTIESSFLEDIGFDLDFIFNNHNDPLKRWSRIPVNTSTFGRGTLNPLTGSFLDAEGVSTLQPVGAADIFSVARSSLVIAGSFFDDLQVDFFLRATQAHQHSTRLNSLRVTLLNGHEAYIIVQTQTDYVSDLTPVVGTAAGLFNPQTDVLVRGVSFGVRATVTADRKYVIMTVYPTLRDDRLAGTFTFQSNNQTITIDVPDAGDGDGDAGGDAVAPAPLRGAGRLRPAPLRGPSAPSPVQPAANASANRFFPQVIDIPVDPITPQGATIQLREASIQEVRTTVMVPDKGTLLLGGQRVADELEIETGVPILSKIPIIKRAFTSRSFVKRERTLLILIRPEILIPEELEPAR